MAKRLSSIPRPKIAKKRKLLTPSERSLSPSSMRSATTRIAEITTTISTRDKTSDLIATTTITKSHTHTIREPSTETTTTRGQEITTTRITTMISEPGSTAGKLAWSSLSESTSQAERASPGERAERLTDRRQEAFGRPKDIQKKAENERKVWENDLYYKINIDSKWKELLTEL